MHAKLQLRKNLCVRDRYKIHDLEATYFLTLTIVAWLPVFTSAAAFQIMGDALTHARKHRGLLLYAYVIMDNHVHLVAKAPDLSGALRSIKSYTAKQLVHWCEESGRDWLLNQFEFYRLKHKTESRFQVWQEGSHPKAIAGDAMLHQKIGYIHQNPLRRGYVDAPEDWRWSSARNYLNVAPVAMEIDLLDE